MLPDELEKRLDGIEDASKKGYPVRNLYKIACEPGLWLQAYVNIRANAGALTQGVSTDTIDGFSIERAEKLAKTLRSREYVAKPVRRVQIPKKDGKTRPLGIPGGDDKLAQEVARIILERGKRLVRTVLIFTESSDQLSRATDRVPGLPASPGYVQ
ncbi:TPA: hypothetical protein ACG5QM_004852 [Escherichia coli]